MNIQYKIYDKELTIKLKIFILIFYLLLNNNAYATSSTMCKEKIIDRSSFLGIYKGFFVAEDGINSIGISVKGDKDLVFLGASEDEAKEIFGNNIDHEYIISYQLEQFWNEEAEECSRIEFLSGGFLARDLDFIKNTAGKYNYKQGYSGYAKIGQFNQKDGSVDIEINTVNEKGNSCSYNGNCIIKGRKIFCKGDSEGDDIVNNFIGINILEYGIEIFNETPIYCGMGVRMSGIYIKNDK